MRALFALLAILPPLAGQEASPTFRSQTQLVQFTVVVTDKEGRAVTDLRQSEVEVSEKGKPRPLSVFRFEGAAGAAAPAQALPPGLFTNRAEFLPGPPRNLTAIVLDTKNTPPADLIWARAQVTRYLKTLAPSTRVAVYHLASTMRVLHDFTDDALALRERVAKATLGVQAEYTSDPGALVREAEQLLTLLGDDPINRQMVTTNLEMQMQADAAARERRLFDTLAALEALGRHLEGIPGRKNLVWISGGIPMITVTGAMGMGPRGEIKNFEGNITQLARRMAQQGIALYVVDSKGLTGPNESNAAIGRPTPIRGRGRFERQQQAEELSIDPLPAATKLAEITGGRVIRNTNDSAEGLKHAAEDLRGAYTVAFYSNDEPDGKWHPVKVKVNRPGARLSYRQGYLAEAAEPDAGPWVNAKWSAALTNPLGSTGVQLNGRCEHANPGDAAEVACVFQMELGDLSFAPGAQGAEAQIEIGVAELNATGLTALHREDGRIPLALKDKEPAASLYHRTWKPRADSTRLRLLLRDRLSGRFGTLDIALKQVPVSTPAAQKVVNPGP